MKNIDLSVIILNYNTKELLLRCLASVSASRLGSYALETIVVDNDSTDGSAATVKKEYPGVSLVQLAKNMGYSAGNNAGINKAKGRFLLLLNSDTELKPDTLKIMLEFMEKDREIGAATCLLVLPDGKMDPACHRGFPTPWTSLTYFLGLEKMMPKSQLFGQYHEGYADMSKPHEIDSPSGAFFLVRRNVVDKVGLLDEDFFMYGEDLDWAYRIKNAGWKIYWNPGTSTIHHKKQSGRANVDPGIRKVTDKYFFNTMSLFYKKHYARKYGWLVTQLVLLGIKIKSL